MYSRCFAYRPLRVKAGLHCANCGREYYYLLVLRTDAFKVRQQPAIYAYLYHFALHVATLHILLAVIQCVAVADNAQNKAVLIVAIVT
jgi:hypothetical protein